MDSPHKNYRDAILDHYLSTTYTDSHADKKSWIGGTDLQQQFTFFKHNYLKHLPADHQSKILELGPGLSQFLRFLRDEGFQNISGIDGSSEVAKYGAELGLNIERTDNFVLYLQNFTEQLDTVIANDILEHFSKQEFFDLLRAIYGSLKKGGRLIAKVPNAACLFGSTTRYWDFTHEIGLTENSLRQVLMAVGFQEINILEPELFCFYKNPLNYVGKFFYLLQKYLQIALQKLNGNFGIKTVSNNLIVIAIK